jgi:uncharacterized protein
MAVDIGTRISGLEALIQAQAGKGVPPVERWDPPYCGDIGLAIAADGTWFYGGSPIGRIGLVKLFASVLRKDADGRHYLVTPAEKVDVAVADAPFLAVEMEARGEGRAQELIFRTNVDDIVVAGAEHPLRFAVATEAGGLKPYLLVRGRLEALVTRALYYDLGFFALPQVGDQGAAMTSALDGEPFTEARFRQLARLGLKQEPSTAIFDARTGRAYGPSDWDLNPELKGDLAAMAPPRPAAVLVPIVLRDELTVLLTQRSHDMRRPGMPRRSTAPCARPTRRSACRAPTSSRWVSLTAIAPAPDFRSARWLAWCAPSSTACSMRARCWKCSRCLSPS